MDTDVLLDLASAGDSSAIRTLFTGHKSRLRRMVAVRIDPRLAPRLDPSDVVQDALAEAHRRLPTYLESRDVPFYPWLRKIAWEKLVHIHRRHVLADRRSVRREVHSLGLSGESRMLLADRVLARTRSPSEELIRQELRARLEQAIAELPERDREVITLKHLEELTFKEAAVVLGVGETAVYSRYRRAIERLHKLVGRQ